MNSTALENQGKKQHSGYSPLVKAQVVIAIVALTVTIIVVFQIGSLFEIKTGLEEEIKKNEKKLEEIKKEIDILKPLARTGLGFKTIDLSQESSVPEQSLKASIAANELAKLSSEIDRERRKHITIQYFPKNLNKEVNLNIIVPSLQKFGFRVEKKRAIVTWTPTNAIWFGANVKIDDVKLVAYTLISAGIKLKTIGPFKSPSRRKAPLIQIGALSIKVGEKNIVEKWPELTVEYIRKTEVFTESNGTEDYSLTIERTRE